MQHNWLIKPKDIIDGKVNIYCFGHAGSYPGEYKQLFNQFTDANVYILRLPRQSNQQQWMPRSLSELLDKVSSDVEFKQPFIFFGHSFGGLIAFEMTRLLQRKQQPLPLQLILSSITPIDRRKKTTTLYTLNDVELLKAVESRWGGFPENIRDSKKLLSILLQALREDFMLYESHQFDYLTEVTCPVSLVRGADEALDMLQWNKLCKNVLTEKTISGGHFYFRKTPHALLEYISSVINDLQNKNRIRPIDQLKQWFDYAKALPASMPGALALATTTRDLKVSNRIVQMLEIRENGIIFASHENSQKGRDIKETAHGSGLLYWRETKQQVHLTGRIEKLDESDSDTLWHKRSSDTLPMSVASSQSDRLLDEQALREHAKRLAASGQALQRPRTWHGYILKPEKIEFWQAAEDRLHHRQVYEKKNHTWENYQLQP